ncbi:transcriptional regulator [Photobacterium aphoticum]|uniref:winged helix-turn-helix domain-containing protein n=1 Tax=Photobacterium aphoticum TaxID=754436 RepID=UPI000A7C00E7|nr:winged helix-turn-helix domain-containing protein [Photobacterium aphoticum]GHA31411.1 hypothetical protein GCM10007086_00650 [Photobacterium aphoticum]
MDMINNPQLRLGRFLWQTDSRSLSTDVGSLSSEALVLTQKQFKLLRCLVDASPDVLSHGQIVERVWQSRPISQESLAQLISRTRNTLCDRDKTILVNVPSKGYKLVFTVVNSAPTLFSETEDSPAIAENSEICTNKTKQPCFTKKVFFGGCTLLFAASLYQAYALVKAVYYKHEYLSIMQATPYPYINRDETGQRTIVTIDDHECHYTKGKHFLKCIKTNN